MSRRALIPVVTGIPLAMIAIFVVASRWIVPNATRQDIMTGVTSPGTTGHLFGTDQLGRDITQLAIAGASSAVVGPVVIALGSMIIGVMLGTFAGYMGGWLVQREDL